MSDASSAIERAQLAVAAELASAGDWLTGAERVDAWREARDARTNPLDEARRQAISPNAVAGAHPSPAVEVVHRVTTDPGRLTRSWADEQLAALGEERYTELVGVTAIVAVLDTFQRAMGRPDHAVPAPVPGEPARVRPQDVGDVGAWVSQSTGPTRANVSRTLSLVPETNRLWRQLVDTNYSRGASFFDLSWEYPLSRPQAELVAARSTALNECFY